MGFVVWFTGLPGAGKTTIASLLAAHLRESGLVVEHLDGDRVRSAASRPLGFSKEERDANVARVAAAAAAAAARGEAAVVSLISPYADARDSARAEIEQIGSFVEVHVATPLTECVRRDPKGLYARALAGEINDFTGVSAPYEEPAHPEVRIDTTDQEPADSVALAVAELERLGLVGEAFS